MLRGQPGLRLYGLNDVLCVTLTLIVLIIGAPVIALILNGFRRDYDKMQSIQREAWKAHIGSIMGKDLRLRDAGPDVRKPVDDWGFWTLEDAENIGES